MQVEVIELRRGGARRSKDELKKAKAVRCTLLLKRARRKEFPGQRDVPRRAMVYDDQHETVFPALDDWVVIEVSTSGLLVGGQQRCYRLDRWEVVPQVWWCRFVVPADASRDNRPTITTPGRTHERV